jgi:hypothetical protein
MEKKLKVKLSNFKTTLTFNEWCEKYNVGSHYVEPTQYFTGHLGGSMNTRYEFLPEVSQVEGKFTGILNKLKTKIKWVEKIV